MIYMTVQIVITNGRNGLQKFFKGMHLVVSENEMLYSHFALKAIRIVFTQLHLNCVILRV